MVIEIALIVILAVTTGAGLIFQRIRVQTLENTVAVLRLTVEMQHHDIAALQEKTQALSQMAVVEIDGASRLVQGPHNHVFSLAPLVSDANSDTYHCQVPYCDRVSTVMR